MFGAGGGTSSYREIEETDVVLLWGSNARETHPIFFHHLLKGVHAGARLHVIDPRRTTSAQWADRWLGLDVGSDIALAHTMAREIVHAGLHNRAFVERATTGFDEFVASIEPFTLDEGERLTGVPAEAIRETAHAFARADRAMICWTLGITEHHNAVDNVLALINLGLLCGHVGRYGSGLNPLRGQNNVQGGGDMGALPNKLPGFQDVENPELLAKFEATYGVELNPKRGWHLTQMFEAMEAGKLRALYVIGENPAQSEADVTVTRRALEGLDFLVVQDMFLTKTAEMADVVFPAAADWCESDGTVTSSERRVQLVRKALDPPGEARPDTEILLAMARQLGFDWGEPTPEAIWDECRSLSPPHAGMSYARLEQLGGIQWPCYDENHPGEQFLHSRLWSDDVGRPAQFTPVTHVLPADELAPDYPYRLTTGRQLDSYNTGVQSGGFSSPRRPGGALELSQIDADDLGVEDGDTVRVSSRRGSIDVPARITDDLRPGLMFLPIHFPDEIDVNVLTIDAWDQKSGTADFKATAVKVEKL